MSIAIQNPEISWEYSPSLIRMLGFIMSEGKLVTPIPCCKCILQYFVNDWLQNQVAANVDL